MFRFIIFLKDKMVPMSFFREELHVSSKCHDSFRYLWFRLNGATPKADIAAQIITDPTQYFIFGTREYDLNLPPFLRRTNARVIDPKSSFLVSSVHNTRYNWSRVQPTWRLANFSIFLMSALRNNVFVAARLPCFPHFKRALLFVWREICLLVPVLNSFVSWITVFRRSQRDIISRYFTSLNLSKGLRPLPDLISWEPFFLNLFSV